MRRIAPALVLALAGCVQSTQVRPLRQFEIATGRYHERGTQSFVGSLMYEGHCLVFDGERGSPRLLPIWPGGSRFEESLLTFHQPAKSDQRVVIGEEIRLDGRSANWAQLDPRSYASFRAECGWATPFFVSGLAPAN